MAKRGPKPTSARIVNDPNRPAIERALALGLPLARIAARFNHGKDAIAKHRDRMAPQLRAAIIAASLKPKEVDLDQLKIDESEGILTGLAAQRARLLLMQDECVEAGAVEQVAKLSNVIHRNIEMVGKYLGLFAQHHVSTQVNILLTEDYLKLRQLLVAALQPYPDAKQAVSAALHTLEAEAAGKIVAQPPPRTSLTGIEHRPPRVLIKQFADGPSAAAVLEHDMPPSLRPNERGWARYRHSDAPAEPGVLEHATSEHDVPASTRRNGSGRARLRRPGADSESVTSTPSPSLFGNLRRPER